MISIGLGSMRVPACFVARVLLLLATTAAAGIPSDSTNLGQYPSIVLSTHAGPMVLYNSQLGLKQALCADAMCSRVTKSQLVCSGPLASSATPVRGLSNNLPVVAYAIREADSSVKAVGLFCDSYSCDKFVTQILDDGDAGYAVSIVVNPAFQSFTYAYYEYHPDRLVVASCSSAVACSSPHRAYPTLIGQHFAGSAGTTGLVVRDNGFPIISFHTWDANGTTGHLKLAVCNDPVCDSSDIVTLDARSAQYSSVVLDSHGVPMVAYVDVTYAALKIAYCNDPVCSPKSIVLINTGVRSLGSSHLITFPVLRMGRDGYPVIAFFLGSSLRLLRCRSYHCEIVNPIVDVVIVDYNENWYTTNMQISMELRPDYVPLIAYSVTMSNTSKSFVAIAVCNDESCSQPSLNVLDDREVMPTSTLTFSWGIFLSIEVPMVLFTGLIVFFGRWYRNKSSIVNDFALMPFTSRVVLHSRQKHRVKVAFILTSTAAIVATLPWAIYYGDQIDEYSVIFVCSLLATSSVVLVWVSLTHAAPMILLVSALFVVANLLIAPLPIAYVVNVVSSICQTDPPSVPQLISLCGLSLLVLSETVVLYLCARAYTAIVLATPARPGLTEDDFEESESYF